MGYTSVMNFSQMQLFYRNNNFHVRLYNFLFKSIDFPAISLHIYNRKYYSLSFLLNSLSIFCILSYPIVFNYACKCRNQILCRNEIMMKTMYHYVNETIKNRSLKRLILLS